MNVASQRKGLKVVGFIRSEDQVVCRTIVSAPEILLLDVNLVGATCRELVRELRTFLPSLKILLYGIDSTTPGSRRNLTATSASGIDACTLVARGEHNNHLDLQCALSTATGNAAAPQAGTKAPVVKAPDVVASSKPAGKLVPEALVIASSTGGPMALMALLKMLPKSFPLPIGIIQHMPPSFTTMLAERLNSSSELEVLEGEAGMEFIPGRIILGPGDFHMKLQGSRQRCSISLDRGEREHSCRPAANVLFRSAAEVYGGKLLTLVLTGMGRDGFEGARQLRALGSRVIVQDAETSTVWGMPGAIAQAGLADAILPLPEIANELMRCL